MEQSDKNCQEYPKTKLTLLVLIDLHLDEKSPFKVDVSRKTSHFNIKPQSTYDVRGE